MTLRGGGVLGCGGVLSRNKLRESKLTDSLVQVNIKQLLTENLTTRKSVP
jgi:hypothetical protein